MQALGLVRIAEEWVMQALGLVRIAEEWVMQALGLVRIAEEWVMQALGLVRIVEEWVMQALGLVTIVEEWVMQTLGVVKISNFVLKKCHGIKKRDWAQIACINRMTDSHDSLQLPRLTLMIILSELVIKMIYLTTYSNLKLNMDLYIHIFIWSFLIIILVPHFTPNKSSPEFKVSKRRVSNTSVWQYPLSNFYF